MLIPPRTVAPARLLTAVPWPCLMLPLNSLTDHSVPNRTLQVADVSLARYKFSKEVEKALNDQVRMLWGERK